MIGKTLASITLLSLASCSQSAHAPQADAGPPPSQVDAGLPPSQVDAGPPPSPADADPVATQGDAGAEGGTQLAFPGAEGFGRFVTGGRGGRVLRVTNLDDSGPGSLRAAVQATGKRIVVFDVDGEIELNNPLVMRSGDVTIAGQTAPGGGITLKNRALQIDANNVIVRYLRVRVGDEARLDTDAIALDGGANIIIDHVSASWSTDETLSVAQTYTPDGVVRHLTDVTVQWSIVSESLNHSVHSKGDHGYGSLIQGSYGARYSFHHNLWAHHQARMPRLGNNAGADKDPDGLLCDFRNNVLYNWGDGATTDFYNWAPGVAAGLALDPFYGRPDNDSRYAAGVDLNTNAVVQANFVNNAYIQGSNSGGPLTFYLRNMAAALHLDGNSMDGTVMPDQWGSVISSRGDDWKRADPFEAVLVPTTEAAAALIAVLEQAGASKWRDPVDDRVVDSVRLGTGGIIDSQTEVGGWPALLQGTPKPDTDGDGMPDDWERANGLDPDDGTDGTEDRNGDGWTNVEEWLNSLVE